MPISDEDIRWLFSLLESENLAEIEVREAAAEVLVRRHDTLPLALPCHAGDALHRADLPAGPVVPVLPDNVVPVAAPMSGVFYAAPSPDSPPYVEVGQLVETGDTIGLIEAMKLFNDVPASATGKVYEVLVGNEQHVEAGQPLILIET